MLSQIRILLTLYSDWEDSSDDDDGNDNNDDQIYGKILNKSKEICSLLKMLITADELGKIMDIAECDYKLGEILKLFVRVLGKKKEKDFKELLVPLSLLSCRLNLILHLFNEGSKYEKLLTFGPFMLSLMEPFDRSNADYDSTQELKKISSLFDRILAELENAKVEKKIQPEFKKAELQNDEQAEQDKAVKERAWFMYYYGRCASNFSKAKGMSIYADAIEMLNSAFDDQAPTCRIFVYLQKFRQRCDDDDSEKLRNSQKKLIDWCKQVTDWENKDEKLAMIQEAWDCLKDLDSCLEVWD